MYHWREECQHAMLDELEWQREDAKLTPAERDRAVTDLIELVAGVDGILQAQAAADVEYFVAIAGRDFSADERRALDAGLLKAYRWQYIVTGVQHPHFMRLLTSLTTPDQMARIEQALIPIMHVVSVLPGCVSDSSRSARRRAPARGVSPAGLSRRST